MRAVVATKQCEDGISTIVIRDNEPKPTIHKSDYVLIRIYYAAINPFDWQLVQCLMGNSAPVTPPFICGRDFCGKVIEIGTNVTNCKVGDFVCGQSYTNYGSMADYTRISSSRIMKFNPEKISLKIAASIPCIGQTAWQSLIIHANLNCNHKLLILGGTTQCGIIGIQIAKNIVKVKNITVTSSKDEYCLNVLGVDKVINYKKKQVWYEMLKQYEFDVIFDCIGGDESWVNAEKYGVLKNKTGVFVTIVGDDNSGNSWTNWMRSGYKYVEMKGKQNLDDVMHFIGNKKIEPLIDENGIFEFDEAVELFKYAKGRKGFGKCLLKVFDDKKSDENKNNDNDDNDDDIKMEEKKQVSTELKWDAVNNGKNVDFKEKYQRVQGRWGWNICVGDRIISKQDYDKYEWEIKCNNIGGGKYCLGFIDAPMDDTWNDVIDDWNVWMSRYKLRMQYSVYINNGNDYFVLDGGYNGLNNVKYDGINGCKFGNDDVFRFRVDFVKGCVELIYNDKNVGVIFDNIPNDIVPCVALYKKCDLSIKNCV